MGSTVITFYVDWSLVEKNPRDDINDGCGR
jgi:hypothetical protein